MDLLSEFEDLYKKVYIENLLLETDREYDVQVSKFVSKYGTLENHPFFEQLDNIIEGENDDKGYLAYNIKHTYWRRIKKYEKVRDLEERYRNRYINRESFPILHLRLEINLSAKTDEEKLEMAQNLRNKYPNNCGVVHDYCMMVANIYEFGEERIKRDILDNYIWDCKECIDRVAQNNYAKFLWTKARIYTILGGIEEDESKFNLYYHIAIESIKRAWMKEELGEQYSLRIATYRNCELYIKNKYMLDQAQRDLRKREYEQIRSMDSFRNEISELKARNLEVIGLFVAIISFTIGSFEIVKQAKFIDQIFSIIILMCMTLVVYGGLGIILHGKKFCLRNIIIIILGIIVIVGVVICWLRLYQLGIAT